LRIAAGCSPLDILRSSAAAIAAGCHLEVSYSKEMVSTHFDTRWKNLMPGLKFKEESKEEFLQRVHRGDFLRIRCLFAPDEDLYQAAAIHATTLLLNPVLANGRFEMLHYLREISLSIDYHRYGNLGLREKEKRAPIL
jgi:RHH-type transcriptional regulator, proline utilization regulon repressor / proline dehydrogenase / delta 1-pyrroline-5-carboxylate dehydrogenase